MCTRDGQFRRLLLVWIAVLFCAGPLTAVRAQAPSPAAATLHVDAGPPVMIRNGRGAARLKVSNPAKSAIPLALGAGIFTDDISKAEIEGPKTEFFLDDGNAMPANIEPGQEIEAVARFTGFSGAGLASADLYNHGLKVGTLQLAAVDAQLNLAIDGPGTASEPITFAYGSTAVITLKNNGKDYVNFTWKFYYAGEVIANGTATMGPGTTHRIFLKPPPNVYSLVDSLKPGTRTATLVLRPQTPPGVDSSLFGPLPLTVSLVMERRGPETSQALFAMYVMVLLLIGGALSLLVNSILPNLQKKKEFEKRVASLADRTSTVSTRVDSYLRVLLRLERKKIEMALEEVQWYSFTAGEKIDAVSVAIDQLNKRLSVAESLDELRRKFEDVSSWAPPSATDILDQTLTTAGNRLHAFELSSDDVEAANAELAKARATLDEVYNSDLQAKRVAACFKQMRTRLGVFPKSYYADLEEALTGIFNIFDQPFDDPANIVAPMVFAIDHAITAGQIALDYAMVRATVAHPATPDGPNPGEQAMKRLKAREQELINLLATISWKALRSANLLVQQMRENIYGEDILAEFVLARENKKRLVRIAYDTLRARPYLPVYFSVAFEDPRFENAAALRRLLFHWTFPQRITEHGYKVCHYFTGEEPGLPSLEDMDETAESARRRDPHPTESWILKRFRYWREKRLRNRGGFRTNVSVEVRSPDFDNTFATLDDKVRLNPPSVLGRSRLGIEFVRFLFAFGVALVAIEAGVIDQLKKLDFLVLTVAVIGMGFGADNVKNLLGQSPKKPS